MRRALSFFERYRFRFFWFFPIILLFGEVVDLKWKMHPLPFFEYGIMVYFLGAALFAVAALATGYLWIKKERTGKNVISSIMVTCGHLFVLAWCVNFVLIQGKMIR